MATVAFPLGIADWQHDYDSLPPVGIRARHSVHGLCKKAFGGRFLYASVELRFEPSQGLHFSVEMADSVRLECEREGWTRAICLGVLDAMIVYPPTPITRFACFIEEIESHPVDSSKHAFRLAARSGATICIEKEQFSHM